MLENARKLVIPGRLELPTCGLGNRRSIRLSYGTGRLYLAQANRGRMGGKFLLLPGCYNSAHEESRIFHPAEI
jgi:hypothetical protein